MALADKGAIAELLAALKQHCRDALLCERAARALVVLSFESKDRSRSIYNGGTGMQIFAEAFRVHVHHTSVLCELAHAFKNVCGSLFRDASDQKTDLPVVLPCCEALASAMQRHISHAEFVRQGCSALGNVALNSVLNARLPLGVVDVMLDAMHELRFDYQVQIRGMMTLFNLANPKNAGPAARALSPKHDRRDMYCTRLFHQVASVLDLHGDKHELVSVTLKALGKFHEVHKVPHAVTSRFSQRLAANAQRERRKPNSSEWGERGHRAIAGEWTTLAKKGAVAKGAQV